MNKVFNIADDYSIAANDSKINNNYDVEKIRADFPIIPTFIVECTGPRNIPRRLLRWAVKKLLIFLMRIVIMK
jgi:hypothetical protein